MALTTTYDKNLGPGGSLTISFAPITSPVDAVYWVAPFACTVTKIQYRPTATAAGATAVVKKAPSGTAIASGTALHSNNFTLDGTANTNQDGTLSATAADRDLAAGDSIGVDFGGTTTNATGVFTITVVPK